MARGEIGGFGFKREIYKRALPQIFDVMTALEDKPITDLISALQIEALAKPENSISYDELRDGMEVKIEKAFFDESRAHLPDRKP